ncbi:MAG: hypothetical protein IH991_09980 [Planctomycetes bacterium]|nr:hypothetical protein [Planctomycetota bacterium]
MSEYLQYVARIFVPTSAEMGKNGTAYPIAPNRVITAAHVLDGWDEAHPVEVWWNQHAETKARGWLRAEIKWDGREEDLDVAILETDFPEQIHGYAPLSLRAPEFEASFESRGFPTVGKQKDTRDAVPITGEVIQYLEIDKEVSLGIKFGVKEGQEKEEALDWKGASGSPVIIGDRFVGVLVNSPVGFGAKRAHALPFCVLAQNHAFFDAIEFTTDLEQLQRIREERRDSVLRELTKLLQAEDALTDALLHELKAKNVDTSEADNKVNPVSRAAALSALLLSIEPKATLDALLMLTERGRSSFQHEQASAIRRIMEFVLPVTFDQIDSRIRLARQNDDSLAVQAASRTMAELVIASLENREARFTQPDVETQNLPSGERCLPTSMLVAPELGDRSNLADRVDSVIRQIARKARVGDKSVVPEEATEFDLPEVINILRECLRGLRSDGGALYFAFGKNEDKDGRLFKTAIALKQKVRELAVVSLQGDGTVYLKEFQSLKSLRDLLQELSKLTAEPR